MHTVWTGRSERKATTSLVSLSVSSVTDNVTSGSGRNGLVSMTCCNVCASDMVFSLSIPSFLPSYRDNQRQCQALSPCCWCYHRPPETTAPAVWHRSSEQRRRQVHRHQRARRHLRGRRHL